MIWSLPPETMRPSGNSEDGGTIARELTNSLPWVLIVLSHTGGFEDCWAQTRTVKSRDAETTEVGEGKATLRTCGDHKYGTQRHYCSSAREQAIPALTSSSWPRKVADSLKSAMVEVST